MLGEANVQSAPSPDATPGDYSEDWRAAKVTPTGQDPESEDSSLGTPAGVEPGTSASGLSLESKTAAWENSAADLIFDICVAHKIATELPEVLKSKKAAAAAQNPAPNKTAAAAPATSSAQPADSQNPYLLLTNGNEKEAGEAYAAVSGELADAYLTGKQAADLTAQYLYQLQAEANKPQANKFASVQRLFTTKKANSQKLSRR